MQIPAVLSPSVEMVGPTSAKSCDGRGKSVGGMRIESKSHAVQKASGDSRCVQGSVAIGGAPWVVNSSERCSACTKIEKGCGAGARWAVSGAPQKHYSGLVASAHDVPPLRTAVARKTEVHKVLRSPSELQKSRLRDTAACSKTAEHLQPGCNRQGGHSLNLHPEKHDGERRLSGSCCNVQRSLVNRNARCRPLVRVGQTPKCLSLARA